MAKKNVVKIHYRPLVPFFVVVAELKNEFKINFIFFPFLWLSILKQHIIYTNVVLSRLHNTPDDSIQ